MTYDDIKNKLSTPEEEYDENKLTLTIDLRSNDRSKFDEYGVTADHIFEHSLDVLVDEYIESFLHLQSKVSKYSWEGNELEAAIISNMYSELSKVKEYVIKSLFKNDDELIDYLKKKININVYV